MDRKRIPAAMEATALARAAQDQCAPEANLPTFPRAMAVVAGVLIEGQATHSPGEWQTYNCEFHTSRAWQHFYAHFDHEPTEDHLAHAAIRLLMALELRERRKD